MSNSSNEPSSSSSVDPLARGQLALGVLGGDARLAAAKPGGCALLLKRLDNIFHALAPSGNSWLPDIAGQRPKRQVATVNQRRLASHPHAKRQVGRLAGEIAVLAEAEVGAVGIALVGDVADDGEGLKLRR